ncbi:MAG: XrtA system polysaccharide chain length determinant, partial [Nitrospirota bacterium]
QEAFGPNKFLSDQIDFYKKKIEEAEERLMSFRREKGLTLATDERTLVSSIKQNKDEMENTEVKIKELEAKKAKMKQQLSGEEPFTVAIIDNKEKGGNLSIRLKMLEQKIPMLLTRYTENYPEVIKTRAEIETIKKQIEAQKQSQGAENASEGDLGSGTSMMNPLYQQLKEDLFRTDSEIDSLKAKITILNIRLKKSESEMQNIPKEKKDLADFERDRNTHQKIYEQLLSRLGRAEVSEQMEVQDKGTTFRVVDPAILPTRPVSPNRVLLILIGIVAGAAAGLGAVLLSDYLDNSIRDIDTLKSQLGLQVLAVIPKITTDDDIKKEQRLDRRVYAISLTYLTIIGGIFIREIIVSFLLDR